MLEVREETEVRPQPLWIESLDQRRAQFLIRCSVWMVTLLVGFVQAWSMRFSLSPDGNAYLSIASAYLRGDYPNAINAYCSPMYSWLVAVVLGIFRPSGYWETTILHLINFVGLLVALRCFEFFFVTFLAFLKHSRKSQDNPLLNASSWWLLGYGLFFSTALFVLTLEPTTPDMWVCVVSYLAVGILLRIALHPEKWGYFAAFGFVLGLGYLSKSFYLPLGFVFWGAAWLTRGTLRKGFSGGLIALVFFLLVAGPFVYAISKSEHRFTFGDAGKITYAIAMNPIPVTAMWDSDSNFGITKHRPRLLLSSPRVYEFPTLAKGMHLRLDLGYWLEGATPHFNLRGQLRILRQSAGTLFSLFLTQVEFAAGFLVLLICQRQRRECVAAMARLWPLWLAPAVGCAAYCVVLVENRYVAPFLVFLWLAAFAGVVSIPSAVSRRAAIAVILGILSITGIKSAKYFVTDLLALPRPQNVQWDVAENLSKYGIKPGDKVGLIASKRGFHWALLANVQPAPALPPGEDEVFWNADRATQERVFAAMASAGSRIVVVEDPPPRAAMENWHQLGNTGYYIHSLPANP